MPTVMVPSRVARGTRGAVVAPHHLATSAGLGVLVDGGSAVDAAIATNAVLGVVMPHGCGLGGDAFWLVWDEAAGALTALNGSGRAPAGADPAELRSRGLARIPRRGPLAITVPGAVRSWADAHRRWGRLPAERVLGPAILQASAGFAAWDGFAEAVETTAASIGDAPWTAGFHAVYRHHRRTWRPGEQVRLPALASTLEALASDGLDAFYDGELGDRIARALVRAGAPFTPRDLQAHRSRWDAPIEATYRGVRIATHPPNSSGVVLLQVLEILETFEPPPAAAFGALGWSDARWVHLQLEAAKLAFADRDAHLADPDSGHFSVDALLGRERVVALASRVAPDRASLDLPPARTLVGGTVFLAAVDPEGNAVALIQSNAAGFGSGVVDPATGVHFQNRGASFSLDATHPNVLEPDRRTAHTLLPAMLFRSGERRPWVVAGSMGGDLQPQVVAGFVSALVDARADVAATVAAPRVCVVPDGDDAPPVRVLAESRVDPGIRAALEARGHAIRLVGPFDAALGHGHAIELVDGGPAAGGSLAAATDPRSAGLPAVR